MTFIQRFGDAFNLNVHFHTLALDGVFEADDAEGIVFVPLDAPDHDSRAGGSLSERTPPIRKPS